MKLTTNRTAARWTSTELEQDPGWLFEMDEAGREAIVLAVRKAARAGKDLLDYTRADFDFGRAAPLIDQAFQQAKHGRGVSLLRKLPREALTEDEFKLMTWGIGLHQGVARPQGRTSQYISAVRNVGVDYRSATGRGYSSSSELDYHTDRSDVIVLSCYNKALSGGRSMLISTALAYDRFAERHPQWLPLTRQPLHFSRQGENRHDETPTFSHPLVTVADGRLFIRWNRNRARTAQDLPGVPRMSDELWKALDAFEAMLHEPDIEFSMYLQPGDMQILNGNATLHARTDYEDSPDPQQKRLLFRLWLATPDSVPLPDDWRDVYRTTTPGAVRGGILGDHYDERCRGFDRRQALELGMTFDEGVHR